MPNDARAAPRLSLPPARQCRLTALLALLPLGACDLLSAAPPARMMHDCIGFGSAGGSEPNMMELPLSVLVDGAQARGTIGWSGTTDGYVLHARFSDELTGKVDTLDVQLHEAPDPHGVEPQCGPGAAIISEAAWDGEALQGIETGMFMAALIHGMAKAQGVTE